MTNLTILALIIAVITNIIAITTLIYAKSVDNKREEDHDEQGSHDLNSRNVIFTIKDAVSGQIIVERNIEIFEQ